MNNKLKEGVDFYYNNDGLMVLTKEYLLKRGFCCQSGCANCPYDFGQTLDPNLPLEFQTQCESYPYDPEFDPDEDEEEH